MVRPTIKRLSYASTLLGLSLAFAPSCTPAQHPSPAAGAKPSPSLPLVANRAPRPAPASLPPPPIVSAPRAGDPGASSLAEARLVQTTCEAATNDEIEAQVRKMRREVDQSFQEWHDSQPDCWEADRERWRMLKEQEQNGGDSSYPRPTRAYAPKMMMDEDMSGALGAGGGGYGGGGGGPVAKAASAQPSGAPEAAAKPDKAKSASGTNNQVAGVDEADIVKTDGTYVYFAANGALRIATALEPHLVSVTRLSGQMKELFVEGDRAVVYTTIGGAGNTCTYAYDCQFAGDGSKTTVTVLDIADRAAPKVKRQLELSGSLMAARRIGDAIHTVVADNDTPQSEYETWPENFEMCGTMEDVVRAKFAQLKADNARKIRSKHSVFPTLRENGKEELLCKNGLMRTPLTDGRAFTSIVSFDMKNDEKKPVTATLESRPGAVFASTNSLYVSVVHQKAENPRWYASYPAAQEVSEIHEFSIGEDPAATKYRGSGLVPGHVLNQFAMDEWYGYLRVATTTGHVPDPNASSTVSILAKTPFDGRGSQRGLSSLVRVGAIEHIAPGEDIRSVRFDDDRAYVVTFKKTDPLFVMDLYRPDAPKMLGELKIPGFSTYMHRIDRDHLLSIGFDANDHGDFAFFDGVILQLFDVKNPTDPKLLHKEKIGSRGSSSEAATNHLAFNYSRERGILAVPMTECSGGGDGTFGNEVSFSGLYVYDVDAERGFTRLGGIDHAGANVNCNTWWSNASSQVKRSLFIDDLVYSIASDRVKVQRLDHFGKDVADISFEN